MRKIRIPGERPNKPLMEMQPQLPWKPKIMKVPGVWINHQRQYLVWSGSVYVALDMFLGHFLYC